MKFKVGDYVQLLDEAYGGIITSHIPPRSYEIHTLEGFYEVHEEQTLVIAADPNNYNSSTSPLPKDFIHTRENKKSSPEDTVKIVDLHCYDLPKSSSSSNKALRVQLDKVKMEMNHALDKNLKEIIFIHGKGEGVLRLGIRRLLDQEYPESSYMDASFRDFGMDGATRVLCL
jgi:hypothetical protein